MRAGQLGVECAMPLALRHRMAGLLFLGTVINYVDRVNISIAAPAMLRDTGWSKSELGWVFSAFLIGNALLQVPAGMIADRRGSRAVLTVAFVGFSVFTLLTPLAAGSLGLLLVTRFLPGAFELMTFPAVISFNARWIPAREFGRTHTFSVSGVTVGQMAAYPLTTWIIAVGDWQLVFYVNAMLGLAWAVACAFDPETYKSRLFSNKFR